MLYGRLAQGCRSLLHRSSSPFFIYLRDHNQHITPEDSRLNLSYARPSNLVPDMPKHKFINFKLDPELEELLERQIFEEYKSKVLRGIVDEIEEVAPALFRNNQIRFGARNQSPSTTSIGSARSTSWQSPTRSDLTSNPHSMQPTVPTLPHRTLRISRLKWSRVAATRTSLNCVSRRGRTARQGKYGSPLRKD